MIVINNGRVLRHNLRPGKEDSTMRREESIGAGEVGQPLRAAARVRALTLAAGLAAIVATTSAAAWAAGDWPDLEPGLWQFSRTLHAGSKPSIIERQVCVDPVTEWKKQQEALRRNGCTVSTRKVAANRYETSARCDIANVGKGSSRSTAVIKNAGAYEVTVENDGVLARTGARERLVAKRLGDCPK
jgi:hypothetical protein